MSIYNSHVKINGDKYYYLEDDIQRPYARDIEWINDQLCIKGKLVHREDGPAVQYFDGSEHYYQYGKLHRIGGPAIEDINGYRAYWVNDERHREDGPARKLPNGRIEYWLCNKEFKTKEEWEHYRDYLMIME